MTLAPANQCAMPTSIPGLPTPRILCIDDDPEVSRMIEYRLRRFDVEVTRAFHGMQGFAEAIKQTPSLVIMDVAMPNGDGATILECLRRNHDTATVPVILLSGMRDPALRRRMFHLGGNQFLRKPVQVDLLIHEISRFMELRERDA
jgi:DNA-binding response OmpR family regulator